MTRFDDRLAPLPTRLLAKYGRVATFYEVTKTPDPTTGKMTVTETLEHPVLVSPRQEYDLRFIDGDTIRRGDTSVYVATQGLTFTPTAGMRVSIGADTWTIVSAKPLDPGETTIAYKLQLRK